jgi:hypothetical protein
VEVEAGGKGFTVEYDPLPRTDLPPGPSVDPGGPCPFAAGTEEKIAVMKARRARGLPLFHPGDSSRPPEPPGRIAGCPAGPRLRFLRLRRPDGAAEPGASD